MNVCVCVCVILVMYCNIYVLTIASVLLILWVVAKFSSHGSPKPLMLKKKK